jgi:hypothetical protein
MLKEENQIPAFVAATSLLEIVPFLRRWLRDARFVGPTIDLFVFDSVKRASFRSQTPCQVLLKVAELIAFSLTRVYVVLCLFVYLCSIPVISNFFFNDFLTFDKLSCRRAFACKCH